MVSIETAKPTEDTRILPLSADTVFAEKFVGLGTDSRVVSTRARRPGLGVPIMASVEKTGTERLNENKTKQRPTPGRVRRGEERGPLPLSLAPSKVHLPGLTVFFPFFYLVPGRREGAERRGGMVLGGLFKTGGRLLAARTATLMTTLGEHFSS